ncbi:type IV secretion protein Rhs [Burkholderia cepacia]|uniref:RHS repeat-associated core domain-containing protein n=1 Tax=Burkholderia cepacia TaxID=292 RepID=UPI000752C31E|nr:RHS repeat-associated core domain-containing protein [Burkholderia cepacia]KVA56904.1 type IV secretion protein Rhs [Burkholderia cepacia]KVA67223.1 type IV secretion protein Rhs [Burkholderia cepacia]KVA80283.1 type IV secretion protein Rhs [Burkholderia cepacia]KVA92413.1 type IV secretion protein Rhs [Burkholderia cepacia]KVA96486.1 type IV secretion protein Rhs [Burkholderia cepacia]
MATPNPQEQQREPQVAVAPLNTIDARDVNRGAQEFDQWLRKVSDGVVTLDRIRTVAGSLPVVGNIIALVDSLGDIVTLSQAKERRLLDWVSLGINLIGVLPAPPTMAAARMSLRPTLFLVRQELKLTGKSLLGDALINVLVAHLNASIVGEIDTFAKEAQGKLNGILKDAGDWGGKAIVDIAGGLEALATGKLNASGDAKAAAEQMRAAGHQLLHDPKASISNFLGAVWGVYKAAGKAAANVAAKALLDERQRELVLRNTQALRNFSPELKSQVARLGDEKVANSIGYLLASLVTALARWRARGAAGQSANVKPKTTSKGERQGSEGMMEAQTRQHPTTKDPNPLKEGCTCAKTERSISFAMGSETLSHTDFSLPGPFPIDWTRTYRSSLGAYDAGDLGARWITPYTTRFDVVGEGLRYHGADGRSHDYPLPKVGEAHDDRIEDLTLIRTGENSLALCRGFERRETYQRHGDRYLLTRIELRGGAGLMLGYDHRVGERVVLSDLVTYQDDLSQPHTHLGTDVDTQGRIIGLWLMGEDAPQRRLSLYRYDEAGDLTIAQDENAQVWTYAYQHHLITRYTDRTGRGMNLEWQGEGPDARAVHEWADDGSFDTRLEWDENIRLTYVTDAHGEETWYYCDILGYTYRIIHPDKRSEWFFRDDAKNVIRHVHPDGSEDRYAYDEVGNLLEHIRADGTVVHYAWDTKNQLIKISDAEGGLWLRDYDTRGRLTEAIDPLGNKTEYAYNLMGLPIGITDASGKTKQLEYDTNGQLTRYVDCSGSASAWAYDERGQLVQFTDAAGNVTRYRYEAGQLAAIRHPDNSEEHFERDAEGRLLAHVDALGRRTEWNYTEAGLLAGRVDAAGQRLRYQWDKLGQLTALRNENGRDAEFHYDPMGRLLAETGFDGATTRYEYEEETGKLARAIDGQRITAYAFDAMGRLAERRAALQTGDAEPGERDWQVETFAYDGNGNLALATNADSRLQWFHDPAGNLVREHQHYTRLGKPLVGVWQHEYDALNQRTATVRPDGHRVSWLTYGSGHLLALQLDDRELVSYERDDLHREIVRTQGNRLLQTQQWDALGRLSEQVLAREAKGPAAQTGGGRLLVRRYRYDASGQLTDINDTRRGQLAYRYDPVGRLLEAQSRLGHETFAFDPASNLIDPAEQREAERQHMPRIKALDNLLKQYAGTHYQYDARGNLSKRWHQGKESRYTWDLFDRLTHYEDERLQADYSYDALGRRLTKYSKAHYEERREAGPHWNRSERVKRNRELQCGFTLYGWDGDTLAWESKIADEDGFGARTTHYVYEPGSFVPVAQAVRQDAIELLDQPEYGDYYRQDEDPLWGPPPPAPPIDGLAWYQCDHLGTPQELTDEQSEIAWAAEYRAWGFAQEAIRKASGKAFVANPIRFQGQYHDHETGLHYNRHRYYDPASGRFVSKDPIGLAGGINVFQYAPNPITWVDALGLTGKPLPGPTKINRIGGNSIDNLRLKEPERKVNPPGISVLHGCCPCVAAQQMRNAFPKATGLLKATETVASGTADAVRGAGFDVIEDPTNKFPNHARIIHPSGADGFSNENLERLSEALGKTTECPR